MPIVNKRSEAMAVFEKAAALNVSIAIFCTASHWNTEAILMAAQRIAEKYGVRGVPVVVANTFNYRHMPQACRFLYCRDPAAGLLSHFGHLRALCDEKYAPYREVLAMPHLDHADIEYDRWALTVGTQYFSSVMFDGQRYSYDKNTEMTRDYVAQYGGDVLVEGIVETLKVEGGASAVLLDNYCGQAKRFADATGVDFLVADLGTEQQAAESGGAVYNKKRALQLTEALGRKMLVLHGTSSLTDGQIRSLADDGVVRVNMWTRIAREAGQYAAESVVNRIGDIRRGVFNDAESERYIRDNVEKAADIMTEMMELFGYGNWRD